MSNSIIFLYSYHHRNTLKVCNAIASKIKAAVVDINTNTENFKLGKYDLIGFGSGIDSGKHYPRMIEYAEKLPEVQNQKAFIFSTSAIYTEKKMSKDHKLLRGILQSKGFKIVGEFSCKGYNTNSFLKFIGGMNKGRPNNEDLKNAEAFAEALAEKLPG